MEPIDLASWPRNEIFRFFSRLSCPFYMISFRLDVTELCRYVKKHGLSFYYSLCWLCTEAVNAVDAFRYVIRGENVFYLPGRAPSCTDLKKGTDNFHIVTLPQIPSMEEFCRRAKAQSEAQTQFIDLSAETDALIYFSCVPWLDMTAVTQERDMSAPGAADDSIPRITWGKYTEQNGRQVLGMAVEVNHRLIDGVHVGRFCEKLTQMIQALDEKEEPELPISR